MEFDEKRKAFHHILHVLPPLSVSSKQLEPETTAPAGRQADMPPVTAPLDFSHKARPAEVGIQMH
jgi:hypothetical protein